MQRRKLLIGLSSVAAGGAAALGTGAFTSVTAERTVNVNVAGDANAYLALNTISGSNNSQKYVTSDPSSGQLEIDMDSSNSNVDGNGLNPNAVTQVDDLFSITNQGTQSVDVYIELSDTGGGTDNTGAVTLYGQADDDSSDRYESGDEIVGSTESETLSTGDTIYISAEFDTSSGPVTSGDLLDNITVYADA